LPIRLRWFGDEDAIGIADVWNPNGSQSTITSMRWR
jgi:hypothetical protein